MHHIDQFTLMMYADKELNADEGDQIELHLSTCSHCKDVYSQLLAHEALLFDSFADTNESRPTVQLNPFTAVQIEAIASLHKKEHAIRSRSFTGWVVTGVAALLMYYDFLDKYVSDWFSSTLSVWQYNILWTSAFWLKENINQFLAVSGSSLLAISLFFCVVLGMLIFLNYRRSSLPEWHRAEGGAEK